MLSRRLQMVADLVPMSNKAVDIGTDHAYLPIHLINSGRCRHVTAVDKRRGPLKKAAGNIRAAGLENKIELCLSDGLKAIDAASQDVIIMAGMGGLEMIQIMENARLESGTLVLQPMKSLPELRFWLGAAGFRISAEKIVCERGYWYVALRAETACEPILYDNLQLWAGPRLLAERPPLYSTYLRKIFQQLQKKARGDAKLQETARQVEKLVAELEQEAAK